MEIEQGYFWEIITIPFNPKLPCRMLESSLYSCRMFESEDECEKDAEDKLMKMNSEEFAYKRESLRIVVKKTKHLGKDYLAV